MDRDTVYSTLDVNTAECQFPADKDFIMGEVVKHHGSADMFNRKLRLQLLLEPLSYSVDLRRLCERTQTEDWDLAPLQEWLGGTGLSCRSRKSIVTTSAAADSSADAGAADSNSGAAVGCSSERAVVVVSGAGEGKSTLSALLCAATRSGVAGYHFIKYSDQRRLEPVRVIKTLAFQLAHRYAYGHMSSTCKQFIVQPRTVAGAWNAAATCRCIFHALLDRRPIWLCRHMRTRGLLVWAMALYAPGCRLPMMAEELLRLSATHVCMVADAVEAFELLLLAPLMAIEAQLCEAGVHVLLLLDALDEADPLEAQHDLVIHASPCTQQESANHDQRGHPAVADLQHARAMAHSTRMCPVPCGNRMLQLLTLHLHRLPPCVRFIITTRPDASSGLAVQTLSRTFAAHGGVRVLPLKTLLCAAPAPDKLAQTHGSVRSASASGGMMVYHTVKTLLQRRAESAALRIDGGLQVPSYVTPSPAESFAASLQDVHALYGKVFEASVLGESSADSCAPGMAQGVRDLVSILMAAQEPLSHALVQQMGYGNCIEHLPGFPTLFFVDEHHLYMLHKSLGDWLLSAPDSGTYAADTQRGHLLLGQHLLAAARRDSTNTGRYALAYLVVHLAAAVGVQAPTSKQRYAVSMAQTALDVALSDFAFMERVLQARCGGRVVGALGSLTSSCHTPLSDGLLRLLRTYLYDL